MARPRTALGTAGSMTVVGQVNQDGRWVQAPEGVKATRWRARAKYRDSDGVLRDVERFAPTKAKAEAKLRAALADRQTPTKGDVLRADMAFVDAAALWLAQAQREDSGLSAGSLRIYEGTVKRHVEGSTIAGLTLREANAVPILRRYVQGVADASGQGTAKTARSVVSAVLRMAVGDGVLPYNAMRDVRAAKPTKASKEKAADARDTRRAFTRDERDALLAFADSHDRSHVLDVVDLVWWLAGTGTRLSEALALSWSDLDVADGTALVRGTKTTASKRTLHLPAWLAERLRERAVSLGTDGLVFPSPWHEHTSEATRDSTRQRDHRNTYRALRALLNEAGHPWATSHTFRRTVASLLDEAGQPIALAANVLGHADPAMTARVYLGRKGGTEAAALVL